MSFEFGKAVYGGTPIGPDEVRRMTADQLTQLRALYNRPSPARTDDVLDQRIAEELQHVKRMLELVEREVARRVPGVVPRLDTAEAVIGDIATIVESKNRCEGLAEAAPDLKRRLRRPTPEGGKGVCDRPA